MYYVHEGEQPQPKTKLNDEKPKFQMPYPKHIETNRKLRSVCMDEKLCRLLSARCALTHSTQNICTDKMKLCLDNRKDNSHCTTENV